MGAALVALFSDMRYLNYRLLGLLCNDELVCLQKIEHHLGHQDVGARAQRRVDLEDLEQVLQDVVPFVDDILGVGALKEALP